LANGEGVARDRWQSAKIQGWYFADRDERLAPPSLVWQRSPSMHSPASDLFTATPQISWEHSLSASVVKRWPLFLATHLFGPLGMKDTQFYLPDSKVDRLAVVYFGH
jgi:hypothetical protein